MRVYVFALRTLPTLVPGIKRWALPRLLTWVDGQGEDPLADRWGVFIAAAMNTYRPALPLPEVFTDEQLRSIRLPMLALIAGHSVMHDPQRVLHRAQAMVPAIQAEVRLQAADAISGQFAEEVNARILTFLRDAEQPHATTPG